MPLARSIGSGMWEIRSQLTGNRIARVIFFIDKEHMVLLNSFIKKTEKTPTKELGLAKKRKANYQSGILEKQYDY